MGTPEKMRTTFLLLGTGVHVLAHNRETMEQETKEMLFAASSGHGYKWDSLV